MALDEEFMLSVIMPKVAMLGVVAAKEQLRTCLASPIFGGSIKDFQK